MEEKIKIIDLICQRHPSNGVDKGWSEYVGGMKDTGQWFFRKMLDVPLEELVEFLNELIRKENIPPRAYTDEEMRKSKIILSDGHGGWITQLGKEELEQWHKEQEHKMLFGLTIDPNKDKK